MKRSTLICVTGGIGAGKSVVSRILRLKGFSVYDCDTRARSLMESSDEMRDGLVDIFGEECVLSDGALDRSFVASQAFSDRSLLSRLNRLVHGAVREDLVRWASIPDADEAVSALRGERRICFVESAIPVTSGLDALCDAIWLVDAPESLRLERAMARGGSCREDIVGRMDAQRAEFDSLPRDRTFVIDNSGDESLLLRIDDLLAHDVLSFINNNRNNFKDK